MPKPFLSDDFLLQSETAKKLYHEFAAQMPIIDYHCHLPPAQIASDHKFENYTQIGLYGDHYKWRAMRANGVSEEFITGNASDKEKFLKWGETVPYTMRNPLYHWTHMELKFPFGVRRLLNELSAEPIYERCNALLKLDEFSVHNLLRKFRVKVVCTTDDPVDSLEYHVAIKNSAYEIKVLPTFRPDKAMVFANAESFKWYVAKLEAATNTVIKNVDDYLQALKQRHDFFHQMGCRLSDHGLEQIPFRSFSASEINNVFNALNSGKEVNGEDMERFQTFMLMHFAEWAWERGWTQQFHLGALRNNNQRMMKLLGADSGFDSIGDFSQARNMAAFFNKLDAEDKLAKTIIYNLNPADNELFATMIGNFNDGSIPGKIQYGAAWWFLDQKDGMEKQINALSNLGLLSRFVGMLTDSRSFLSYSRHEYFRRLLCNMFGQDVENGELPDDIPWLGKMVQDICYNNADRYFGF